MGVMGSSVTVLARYRRHGRTGVGVFVLLLLLAGAERRLADAHFNLRTAAPGLESHDTLDGDEIRVRLVVLNDDKAPVVADAFISLAREALYAIADHCSSSTLGRPAPRGPPALEGPAGSI